MPHQSEEEKEGKLIRVRWAPADELETLYVNHVFISHVGPEFYLIFGEHELPIILAPEDWDEHEEILIVPKVRLALTPEGMVSIFNAIKRNVDRFLKGVDQEED